MSLPTDTFADFVDGLAEALDDHEASGEDWASRHHFSRFHFDRIIKSVGGEPPQTLRRRILLERAAYRMITTKAPLIDIAVEAGYSSHEAFTRAFAKAYDVPRHGEGAGPRAEDGGAPRVADRRDDPGRRPAHARAARRAGRGRGGRRRADAALPAEPA